MSFYSQRNLWNNENQIRRIFGWADLLKEWNDTLNPSVYVTTVIDNLRASSDPVSNYDFPLSHFVTFLNDEQEGLKWLIYEIIAQRWMYSNTRTDYLKELADRVDVDTDFPAFVGSPLNTMTVRQFLEQNLSSDELREVNIIPRLVPQQTNYSFWANQYGLPSSTRANPSIRRANSVHTNVIGSTNAVPRPAVNEKHPYCFQLRFLRPEYKDDTQGKHDTLINIVKNKNGTYNLMFNDNDGDFKNKTPGLTREQVLRYLSVHLRSLAIDDDPFNSVQILPPNAPSVLYELKRVDRAATRDLIYDSLEVSMDCWPTA